MKWTISRQELAMFHARHNRMRFFCEGHDSPAGEKIATKTGFSIYHQQVQDAIRWLGRDIVRLDGVENFRWGNSIFQDDELEFELNVPPAFHEAGVSTALRHYFKYCIDVINWECSEDRLPRTEDLALKATLERFSSEIQRSGKISARLHRKALLNLMSALPILPHWDLWGAFSSNAVRASSTLSEMQSLDLPVYAARLEFFKPIEDDYTPSCESEEILRYRVQLQVGYSSASESEKGLHLAEEGDYFKYCHNPKFQAPVAKQTMGCELTQYRAYGLLFDRIQIALGEVNSDEEQFPKRLFCIAYPIRTFLGRTHFWHLWLRPENADATLDHLWNDWKPVHKNIGWQFSHGIVADELEQIDVAYTQAAIAANISATLAEGKNVNIHEVICQSGNTLFPAHRFTTGEHGWWGYDRHSYPYDQSGESIISLGARWRPETAMATAEKLTWVNVKGSTLRFVPEETGTGDSIRHLIQRSAQKHRHLRLISQQLYSAKATLHAIEAQRHGEQRNREEWERQAEVAVLELPPQVREAMILRLSDHEDSLADFSLKVGDEVVSANAIALRLRGVPELTSDDVRLSVAELFRLGPHEYFSEYLECNPIKMLTHANQSYRTGWTIQRCMQVLESLHGQWASKFEAELNKVNDEYFRKAFIDFQSAVRDLIESHRDGETLDELISRSIRQSPLGETQDKLRGRPARFEISGVRVGDLDSNEVNISRIALSPCLSLPEAYVKKVMVRAVAVCTFSDQPFLPTLFRFRIARKLPAQRDWSNAAGRALLRNVFAFRWGGSGVLDSTVRGVMNSLGPLLEEISGLGRVYLGQISSDSKVRMRAVSSGCLLTEVPRSDYWSRVSTPSDGHWKSALVAWQEACSDVTLVESILLGHNTSLGNNILLVTFDGWYTP